jgi:Mrp family chromosome partitioning ATPase
MAASDGLIISRYCDGLVILVRMNSTSKQGLKIAYKSIIDTGVPILGIVENDFFKGQTGGYKYYNYYSEGGKKEKRKRKYGDPVQSRFGLNGKQENGRKAKKAFENGEEHTHEQPEEPSSDKKKSVLTKSSIDFLSEIESDELERDEDPDDR